MKQTTVDAMLIYYFQYFVYCYFQRITGNFEHIVFVLVKFPFVFLGLNYFSKIIQSTYLLYNPNLYFGNHAFNKKTQYQKNNVLQCHRSRINTEVDFRGGVCLV